MDQPPFRPHGYLPLENYAVVGDGRSVALVGLDGSVDWWCVPDIDSAPLFDRLLDEDAGGRFELAPEEPFEAEHRYRPDSNVLETTFRTPSGMARVTDSMNSGTAGRLPWAELARRVEGIEGEVNFRVLFRPGRRANTASPYQSFIGGRPVFHVRNVLGLLLADEAIVLNRSDGGAEGRFAVATGERRVLAIVAGQDEPLVAPALAQVDERIDLSDQEWRDWAARLTLPEAHRAELVRSLLALKLLLFSPSGAIAAAGTSSLPEKVGGPKNWDYRYAWVRDAGYTIAAFLAAGALAEAKAAFSWLLKRLAERGCRTCYRLSGDPVPTETETDLPGWRGSGPVRVGNRATAQTQHGVFGDVFETAARFAAAGGVLDAASAETLSHLADQCADAWRTRDAGIWELEDQQHYTMSKISCWQALARAVELADAGQLPTTCRDRWSRERDRVEAWIGEHCWSEQRGAYLMHPGSDRLDASLALAVRFGFDGEDRLRRTLDAIDRELGAGPLHYRYSGMDAEEGCFLACTFWMAEARVRLGDRDRAERVVADATAALARGAGAWPEMVDPKTGEWLGNMPQGLTHLAHVTAIHALAGA